MRNTIISYIRVSSWSLGMKISSQVVEVLEDIIIIYVVSVTFWYKKCQALVESFITVAMSRIT